MRSNASCEGNSVSGVLSAAGYGTAGDGTGGLEDGTSYPDGRLVGGTGVRGSGAAGTGNVAFATVSANIFSLEPIWWVQEISLDLPPEPC